MMEKKESKEVGGIRTTFADAVVPVPTPADGWSGVKGGDTTGMLSAAGKETPGETGQGITFVKIEGGPDPGDSGLGKNINGPLSDMAQK